MVVTLGSGGAVAVHAAGVVWRASTVVSVVDTVGAGDAFSGGLLHWLATHDQLDRAALARSTADEPAQALDYAIVAAGPACVRPANRPEVDAARHALSV